MTASFNPPLRTLMGPGPSDVHPRVLSAMARPTIGHLDPAFVAMMDELQAMLRWLFRTENELTIPISAPGSAGMEACFVNLVEPGDTVVICRNGVFGERMRQNVERIGATPVVVDDAWGEAVSPDKLGEALRAHPEASTVAFVHAETSTGVLSDAKALAAIAREHDCLTIVDTVTSLGGCPVEVDAWDIDAAYAGSQKCLSCTPGLAPITFGSRAVERLRARRPPVQSWFLDLNLLMGYWGSDAKRSYHHTAPINPLYGLHESLLLLQEEGLEGAWARHARLHEILVAGLDALDLSLPVAPGARVPQLNAVTVPVGVEEAQVRQRLLYEYGLEIGAGIGDLAGRIWRIGLMGHSCRIPNVLLCLSALGAVLHGKGVTTSHDANTSTH